MSGYVLIVVWVLNGNFIDSEMQEFGDKVSCEIAESTLADIKSDINVSIKTQCIAFKRRRNERINTRNLWKLPSTTSDG